MTRRHGRAVTVLLVFILLAGCLCGCAGKTDIPFSQADWSWKRADMEAAEGRNGTESVSVYGGSTYSYDREYLGAAGTVKYMFDADGNLASVAWACADTDAVRIQNLYERISDELNRKHGDSSFSNPNETALGSVWNLDDCNVALTMLSLESGSALQYAYIEKSHSKKQ